MDTPTVHSIKRAGGIAGQVQYNASVQYPDEPIEIYGFVGHPGEYSSVVAISPSGRQVFVTDPGRLGPFGRQWIQRFFE